MDKLILLVGEGCVNCETMRQVLYNVSNELNIDYEIQDVTQEIINKYDVNGVPTILLIHNNELVDKVKGFQPQEVLQLWVSYKVEECRKIDYNING